MAVTADLKLKSSHVLETCLIKSPVRRYLRAKPGSHVGLEWRVISYWNGIFPFLTDRCETFRSLRRVSWRTGSCAFSVQFSSPKLQNRSAGCVCVITHLHYLFLYTLYTHGSPLLILAFSSYRFLNFPVLPASTLSLSLFRVFTTPEEMLTHVTPPYTPLAQLPIMPSLFWILLWLQRT